MRRIKDFLYIFIYIIFLTSCVVREIERYPELFSVASSSILGVNGYLIGVLAPPSIRILEKDNYGRILFRYHEENRSTTSHLILQKQSEEYVYFYPHYNFLLDAFFDSGIIPSEELERLKELNNWNQPMSDSSKFVRARIVGRKEDGPVSEDKLIEVGKLIFPDATSTERQIIANTIFLRTDRYGRSIYFRRNTAILFQPDHSFDIETGILEITDRFNYQTELRLFMEANGWDTPFEE